MDIDILLHFFTELQQELERLTQLQRQKIDAVRAHDLDVLNDCMKQEQVISLSLRGLEQKREKLLQALGLSGVSLLELDRPQAFHDLCRRSGRHCGRSDRRRRKIRHCRPPRAVD